MFTSLTTTKCTQGARLKRQEKLGSKYFPDPACAYDSWSCVCTKTVTRPGAALLPAVHQPGSPREPAPDAACDMILFFLSKSGWVVVPHLQPVLQCKVGHLSITSFFSLHVNEGRSCLATFVGVSQPRGSDPIVIIMRFKKNPCCTPCDCHGY